MKPLQLKLDRVEFTDEQFYQLCCHNRQAHQRQCSTAESSPFQDKKHIKSLLSQ
jgi:hypothetical protein